MRIEKNQCVPGYDNYLVLDGGEYNDEDLVVVYDINNPALKVAFQAYYIVKGWNKGDELHG